jgi:tRNA (guanine-N7-)-methyltransferase
MAQKKLIRFAEIKTFPNVLEYPGSMKGKWGNFFGNNNPIVLELACGRGEYTVGMSKLFPHKNFIGIDVKGNRMYIGAKKCLQEKVGNAAFLRTQISLINNYFDKGEVAEIWLTFPDPQFLRLYQQFLQEDGSVHLKTDSPDLFRFTKRVIELYGLLLVDANSNVYASDPGEVLAIKTHYEALDIAGSNTIFYLRFNLPATIPGIDKQLQEELKLTENTVQ